MRKLLPTISLQNVSIYIYIYLVSGKRPAPLQLSLCWSGLVKWFILILFYQFMVNCFMYTPLLYISSIIKQQSTWLVNLTSKNWVFLLPESLARELRIRRLDVNNRWSSSSCILWLWMVSLYLSFFSQYIILIYNIKSNVWLYQLTWYKESYFIAQTISTHSIILDNWGSSVYTCPRIMTAHPQGWSSVPAKPLKAERCLTSY